MSLSEMLETQQHSYKQQGDCRCNFDASTRLSALGEAEMEQKKEVWGTQWQYFYSFCSS